MSGLSLSASGIGVRRGGRWVVRGASVEIATGRLVGLVGPNGSGKSTLIRLLAGLWRPDEGTVRLGGEKLGAMPRPEVARRVACVPQETRIEFGFSARQIVAMARYPLRGRFQRETVEDAAAVDQAMQQTDVTHLRDQPATLLSGGERQRLLMARALATGARILLLDEPTSNLDVDHRLEVLDLCRGLVRRGHGVVLATHDLDAAFSSTDITAVIDHGRIVALGRPEDVLSDATLRQTFHVRSERVRGADGTPFLSLKRLSEATEGGFRL
jgi:iron complex transport system ATP-binding protein